MRPSAENLGHGDCPGQRRLIPQNNSRRRVMAAFNRSVVFVEQVKDDLKHRSDILDSPKPFEMLISLLTARIWMFDHESNALHIRYIMGRCAGRSWRGLIS